MLLRLALGGGSERDRRHELRVRSTGANLQRMISAGVFEKAQVHFHGHRVLQSALVTVAESTPNVLARVPQTSFRVRALRGDSQNVGTCVVVAAAVAVREVDAIRRSGAEVESHGVDVQRVERRIQVAYVTITAGE